MVELRRQGGGLSPRPVGDNWVSVTIMTGLWRRGAGNDNDEEYCRASLILLCFKS